MRVIEGFTSVQRMETMQPEILETGRRKVPKPYRQGAKSLFGGNFMVLKCCEIKLWIGRGAERGLEPGFEKRGQHFSVNTYR